MLKMRGKYWATSIILVLSSSMALGTAVAVTDGSVVPPLVRVFSSNRTFSAVTTSDDGRVFLSYPASDDTITGPAVAELGKDGAPHAYPSAEWNNLQASADKSKVFVNVNTLRIGPDGNLWVVDSGNNSGPNQAKPKLVVIDLKQNKVIRTIIIEAGATPTSHVDDLRFHGDWLYLSDTNAPALIVVNQKTGLQRRVLANTRFTIGARPLVIGGKVLKVAGKPLHVHTDQLETSPDGKLLYFQAAAGPLYVVPTAALDDPNLPEKQLEQRVRLFFDSPSTGGTAIDGDGVIYLTDINQSKILKITPDGKATTLIADHRLHWADGMWIDATGKLWIPVLQLDRTAPFQPDGKSHVVWPLEIFTMDVHAKPYH